MTDETKEPNSQSLVVRSAGLAKRGLDLADGLLAASSSLLEAKELEVLRLESIRAGAENGDAEAQFVLANFYYEVPELEEELELSRVQGTAELFDQAGLYELAWIHRCLDTEKREEALERALQQSWAWCHKAAMQEHLEAQYALGSRTVDVKGWEAHNKEALFWCRKAAERGHLEAQKELGLLYSIGIAGIEENTEQAFEWRRRAAEQGDAESQCDVGHCYLCGAGVDRDDSEAFRWLRTAAVNGWFKALEYFAHFPERLVWGEDQILEGAFEECVAAAELGDVEAQETLVLMHDFGPKESREDALRWLIVLADRGIARYQSDLAKRLREGEGAP